MLSVDGTDFCIAMGWSKSFYSYKFNKSGLRYEVGLCIKTGDICWWSGPYEPGIWNDGSFFKDGLVTHLEPGERVEMDRGYRGSAPQYVKSPDGLLADLDPAVKLMVNARFKNWVILCTPYRHEFLEHQTVFGAIVFSPSLLLQPTLCFRLHIN